MIELKPCPFCGCEVELEDIGWNSPLVRFNHPKSDCIVSKFTWSQYASSRDEIEMLINGWNRRVGDE